MSTDSPPPWDVPADVAPPVVLDTPKVACTCRCGCQEPSVVGIQFAGTRIASVARCVSCRQNHSAVPVDTSSEDQWQREAQQQRDADLHAAALTRWRERVPPHFRNATGAHPVIADRLARWRKKQPQRGLYVEGDTGGGKTRLAYTMVNMLVEHRLVNPARVKFGTEIELLESTTRASFADQAGLRAQLMSPRWDVVMIDDVGHASFVRVADQHSLWQELLDGLWRNERSVIITTNLARDQLRDWVSEAAFDRLMAMVGPSGVLTMEQDNMRVKEAKAAEHAWEQRNDPDALPLD